jgi:ATP-dependent DNA helicase RecQ
LSCVYRSGQRFGAAHVIDILRGADTAKVRQHGHAALSTYGVGSDLDAKQWRSVFRQLVAAGLLDVDVEGHGALQLTAASAAVLKGERSLSLRTEPPATPRRRDRNARGGQARGIPAGADALSPEALGRFESLRLWRGETARAQSVPAYVIFHDSTLREIALREPADLEALGQITGVGVGKLERYGRTVLDALHQYEQVS